MGITTMQASRVLSTSVNWLHMSPKIKALKFHHWFLVHLGERNQAQWLSFHLGEEGDEALLMLQSARFF